MLIVKKEHPTGTIYFKDGTKKEFEFNKEDNVEYLMEIERLKYNKEDILKCKIEYYEYLSAFVPGSRRKL